jgi:hypothetical protein
MKARQQPVCATAVVRDGVVVPIADERVRKLVADLPVLPEKRDDINKAAAGLTTILVSYGGRNLPKSEHSGTRITLKELDAVGRLSDRLRNRLDHLHQEAHDVIEDALGTSVQLALCPTVSLTETRIDDPVGKLKTQLSQVYVAAKRARAGLAGLETLPAPRGARPKREAEIVTSAAASIFEWLTGKKVTRIIDSLTGEPTGAFHRFLVEIFDLAGIKANVDEQIRKVVAKP